MSMENKNTVGFTAFCGQVNIELFNDVIEFLAATNADAHQLALASFPLTTVTRLPRKPSACVRHCCRLSPFTGDYT